MNIKNLISELKRRNVFKVATAYAIAGWLIIQVMATISPQLGFPEWIAPFFTVAVLVGFPLALIFAWAFELTPEGLKKSGEVEITESVTDQTGKKLNGIIIGVLSIALFFVVVERLFFAKASFIESTEAEISNASIAVLPFVNMSGDVENEYFSDGLSEELLNGLAKLQGMQVAGRTSSFQFKGSNPDLRDVGEQLGVHHILEGSVRKSGNRIRITAQLIQADNGFHLWSETYDRELTAGDVFDIQEEITRNVVAELRVRLLPEEEETIDERPTQDIEAYNAFLEATQREITRQPEDIEFAIGKYKEAVRIDPTFSLAYARMAYAYSLLYTNGNIPLEEAKAEARRYIDQALTINGNEGKAYQAMATYYRSLEVDYEQALTAAQRAVDLMPNDAMANNMLQIAYGDNEKDDEQEETLLKAYELDPLNPIIAGNYSGYLVRYERFEESLEVLNGILDRNPDYSNALSRKATILANVPYGEIDEAFILAYEAYQTDRRDRNLINALINYSKDLDLYPVAEHLEEELATYYPDNIDVQIAAIMKHFDEGRFDSAEMALEEYLQQFGEDMRENWSGLMANIYFQQGRAEDAVSLLEKYHPEFLNEEIELNDYNAGIAFMYISFGKEIVDFPRGEELQQLLCDYYDERADESREEGKELEAYYDELTCDFIQDNTEVILESYEYAYYEQNNKRGWPQFDRDQSVFFTNVREEPEYKELMARIYADLHEMRDNVIEYLKAEGEWKEEWGGGNSK